jgi:hypothetical protein
VASAAFLQGEAVTVTQPEETPRMLEALPALPEADVDVAVDVAVGIVGGSIDVGLAVLRRVPGQRVLRSRAVWRPAFLPTGLQPATLVTEVARRGARQRARTAAQVGALLDQWTPALVDMVVSRLDLTNLVIRNLDVEGIVEAIDLDALVQKVLADLDLPAIIRESSGSLGAEAVRGARMTGINVDEAIGEAIQRRLFRRRGTPQVSS